MGYGFKIGGRGIILRPTEIKVYDGDTEISELTIEGKSPSKTLRFTYIADNGKLGDGEVKLTSDNEALSVTQTTEQKASNEFTLTFNGMDVDEVDVTLTLSVAETKHFLATETTLNVKLKRSEPTIVLASAELSIVGGSPSGTITVASYDGDGTITAVSSEPSYASVSVTDNSSVAVTYLNGDKSLTVTVGCTAGKFYKASDGVTCSVTCTKSTPTITLGSYSATIYGGGSAFTTTASITGLNGSTANLNTLKILSGNSSVVSATLSSGKVTVSYISAGSTTVSVYTDANNYYYSAKASISVTAKRTTVTIPSLKSTSVACVGSSVSPGVNNLNTTLVTQGGTTSANYVGTFTVTWNLKDTTRYSWTDGTLTQKSQTWSTYAGTVTIYTSALSLIPAITWQGTYGDWTSFKPSNISGGCVQIGTNKYYYAWLFNTGGTPYVGSNYRKTDNSGTIHWYRRSAGISKTGSAPVNGTTYSLSGYTDVITS